jgi:hypothetical protein
MKEKSKKAVGIKLCCNGEADILTFENKKVSLTEMQNVVNGHIEIIYLSNEAVLILNEEGKLNNLPFNELATYLLKSATFNNDYIVGDVLLIHNKYIE